MSEEAVTKQDTQNNRPMKPILIVEDELVLRRSLGDWLTANGYQVEAAAKGDEALKAIDEQDFGIAILDLMLPGKSGIEILREAKQKRPHLRGIIITAFPSVETAVEAMREGAVDYLRKPFDLNKLEKRIRDTLGEVQVEIRAAKPAVAEPPAPAKKAVEKPAAIAPEQAPVHIKIGKAHFRAGRFQDAMKEFLAVLDVMPQSIETRTWLRKAQQALVAPQAETAPGVEKPKYCVWMSIGMVSHRICVNDYNCMNCEFDQDMQQKMASGGTPELEAALARLKSLPGCQRLCRYALKGDVSHRLCSHLFRCAACEFAHGMDDSLQQMLAQRIAELSARQEAMSKKGQNWWWQYWAQTAADKQGGK